MKKIISFVILVFVWANSAYCSYVDTLTAKTVATNFYLARISESNQLKSQSISNQSLAIYLAHEEFSNSESLKSASEPLFYIFNIKEDGGFVIVSAEDRTTPVLGFSLKGEYKANENTPPAFNEWMENYKRQIISIKSNELKSSNVANADWEMYLNSASLKSAASIEEVSPMVTTTWSQNNYYNDLCPENSLGHAMTGCVATAMGQIMKFWDYPPSCTAIPGYVDQPEYDQDSNPVPDTGYGTIPAVSPTAYNWTSMPDVLNSATPGTKVDAVAKLLYHCGVAVQMDYGPYLSSSYVEDAVTAFRNYFDYSSTTKMVYKGNYSNTSWKNLLVNELNNGRPVLYRGDNGISGHAFVCDGYQGTDFFHFNWGWGGYLDNYFYLDDITPADMDFSSHQGAIIGIAPKSLVNLADISLSNIAITSSSTVDAGGSVEVTSVQNYSGTSGTVPNVYLRYYLSTDCSLGSSDVLLGDDYSTINNSTTSETETATLTIPEETPSGSYKILFVADATNVVQESNESNNVYCIDITVNGIQIPEDIMLKNIAVSGTTVDAGGTISVELDQYYSGSSATVPDVYLYYCLSTDCNLDVSDILLDQDFSTISSSDEYDMESATLTIPGETASGTYYIIFFADATNVVDESNEDNNIVCLEITVNNTEIPEDVFLSNVAISSKDTIAAGETIEVTADQNYIGSEVNLFNTYLYYYLSEDCVLDDSDIFLDSDYSSVSAEDAFDTETATLTIPELIPEGTYNILFVADATDVVEEDNNENNYACVEFTIEKAQATLVYISVDGTLEAEENSTSFFTCTATYSDSSKVDITEIASWETNSVNAEITSGTLTTGSVNEDENITVSAHYEGKSAGFEVILKNGPPILVYLTINGPVEAEENSTSFFTCTATYSDSLKVDITEIASWETNSANAEITSGTVTTGSVAEDENITVSANYEGKSADFEVILKDVPPILVYLIIDGPVEVKEESEALYTCTATYSDSSKVDITEFASWQTSSLNTEITSGILTTGSVSEDENCTISVSYEEKSAAYEFAIQNVPPVLVSISIDGPAEVFEDSAAIYSCYALYSDNTVVDITANTAWEITNLSNVLISSGVMEIGSVDFDEAGTISAVYNGKEISFEVVVKNTSVETSVLQWKDNLENLVKVYPNPVRDFLTILFTSPELVNSKVCIINSLGSVVITGELNSSETKIDVSGLVSGFYIVKIQKDDFVYNEKITR
ncbi:MAG: thiol protease/hemagglutinin PrtT [Draconibacterium sp.]